MTFPILAMSSQIVVDKKRFFFQQIALFYSMAAPFLRGLMAGKEPPISIDIQIAGMIHYLVISNCHATKAKDHASSWSGW